MADEDIINFYLNNFICDYEEGIVFLKNKECDNAKLVPVKTRINIAGKKREEEPSKYLVTSIEGKRIYLHRLIYVSYHLHIPEIVDHINGDSMCNILSNLRGVTKRENCLNRKISSRNKTGVNGVSISNNKYEAAIWHEGKKIRLGSFTSIEEAEKARLEANILYGYNENHGKRG